MRKFVFLLVLLGGASASLFAQGGSPGAVPIITNPAGQPIPNASVAICTSDPGPFPTAVCSGLATTYTNLALGTACTGIATNPPTLPLNNRAAPSVGTGCSNPGLADASGNVVAFVTAGTYYCEYYGANLRGFTAQPCLAPSPTAAAAGLADPGSNGPIKRTALNVTAPAAAVDITALWTGTCNVTTFLRGDGSCQTVTSTIVPIQKASSQAGATADVQITNAIAALSGGTGIVWADYSTNQSWAACPTFGSGAVHLVLFPVTHTIAVNCSIPANVTLQFMNGAILSPATATTTTILGSLMAGRQQIFANALAGQGAISFTNSTKTSVLYPQWFGAKADGVANDLPALQAVADVAGAATASTPGASIIDLGCGTYSLSGGQWTIASSNGQHHVNVVGVNPLCTTIDSAVAAFPATAIYLSKEKFVSLSGFFLHCNTAHQGVGITMGGLTGSGTQTNGSTLDNITVDNCDTGILTTDSVVLTTSSEIIFNQLVLQNNNTGFINTSFNGLNYVFNLLSTVNNAVNGVDMETPGITVNGGDSSSNGTDFKFGSGAGPGNTITNFRSETAVTQCINMTGDTNLTLIGYACQGLSTPTTHTAITQSSAGLLTILSSFIGGQILETSRGSITIANSRIIDPNNTWSPSNQVALMGPGFRMQNPMICGTGGSGTLTTTCAHYNVTNTYIVDATISIQYQIASAIGWITAGTASIAVPTNNAIQGPALTVASNAITVTAYTHHVGAGLIKNINLPTDATYTLEGTVNWEMNCVQLIADAAYTTDTTGNISVALTATIGQVITWCYDPAGTKWYPQSGSGDHTALSVTDPGVFGSSQTNTSAACETSFGATTLNVGGTTTDTGLNCLPGNAVIDAVVYRITVTVTTAANFLIGDATTAGRFCGTQSTLTAGTTGVCFVQADQTGAPGPRQASAAKVRVTTNANPGAGAIRLIVYYHTWTAPTS